MGIINIVENVKKIHPEYVVFVNIGKFYYTYGRDSYIISPSIRNINTPDHTNNNYTSRLTLIL